MHILLIDASLKDLTKLKKMPDSSRQLSMYQIDSLTAAFLILQEERELK